MARVVKLSEMDRALLKFCANNNAGEKDDLFAYIGVGTKLGLSEIAATMVECDKDATESYELEDAEFKFIKKLYDGQKKWPYPWAEDVRNLDQRLQMAEVAKSKRSGKSKTDDVALDE